MKHNQIYEDMLEGFQTLEEYELVNDNCLNIFTNSLQNKYDEKK
mgnify:CR=1 FL=1